MPSISAVAAASRSTIVRYLAFVLAAVSLGACAQSSVVSRKSEFTASRQAAIERQREARLARSERVSIVRRHEPSANKDSTGLKLGARGVASFYNEGTQTASGERFNPAELTAAHPTLPFGTKLRVTNTTTGRSVTVRVNDRGPFVSGRVVDVSYSAAQALGMVKSGTANVRLDVVQ